MTFNISKKGCNVREVLIRKEEVERASHAEEKEQRENEEEECKAKESDWDVLALSLVVWGGHLKY